MTALPTLFISHGSPMLALRDSPARQFLAQLGPALPRPKAILVASAHWETLHDPAVSLAAHPETIHDFGGFPRELFAIEYPAPGAPDVAERAAGLLASAGFAVQRSASRGLDHGAWVPLRLMFPDADIPVFQVSIVHGGSPATHERLGAALSSLREQGVLVIGSGSLTHNLHEFRGQPVDAPAEQWVRDFGDWMHEAVTGGNRDALLNYRTLAPHAVRNHPTDEHLMPLYVALGAGESQGHAERIHTSHEHSVLAMDVYRFS